MVAFPEVAESDFATGLAKTETEEADAQDEYEKVTQENQVSKSSKMQDAGGPERACGNSARSACRSCGRCQAAAPAFAPCGPSVEAGRSMIRI